MAQTAQEQSAGFREQPVISSHQQKQFNRDVTKGLAFAIFCILVFQWLAFKTDSTGETNELAFVTNVATELIGVAVTIVFVNRYQDQRALDHLAKELVFEVRYGENADVIRAINRMRFYDDDYGWYSSRNSLLVEAHLGNARLDGADLADANLTRANLGAARLEYADLARAKLIQAKLEQAFLTECQLEGADLHNAYLVGAQLKRAYLVGANLTGADLKAVSLDGAILPDGSTYTKGRDLREFTHPEEWAAEQ